MTSKFTRITPTGKDRARMTWNQVSDLNCPISGKLPRFRPVAGCGRITGQVSRGYSCHGISQNDLLIREFARFRGKSAGEGTSSRTDRLGISLVGISLNSPIWVSSRNFVAGGLLRKRQFPGRSATRGSKENGSFPRKMPIPTVTIV